MKKYKEGRFPGNADDLRQRADEIIGKAATRRGLEQPEPTGVDRLVHELQVHQIELELQNEELRRAQTELESTKARYFDLYDLAPVGYLTISESGLIRESNLTATTLLGTSRGALDRQPLSRFILKEDQDIYYLHRKNLIETGMPQFCELRLQRADTTTFWARLEGNLAHDAEGLPLCRIVLSDISARKQVEEALGQALRELRRSNLDHEQFACIASHDLQAPLRIISGFLNRLAERYSPQLDDKAREYIGQSVASAQRMSQLINDLLAYSRIGREVETVTVATDAAVVAALANLQTGLTESGANITCAPLPSVTVNLGELTQVFQNLIGNSLKFRRPGVAPEIHIAAEKTSGKRLALAGEGVKEPRLLNQDIWLITVRDNGLGIDPQYAERIFTIFQRLHSREAYPGTGVGLAICKKVIERHGGRIWVESEPDKGATFCFTLPA